MWRFPAWSERAKHGPFLRGLDEEMCVRRYDSHVNRYHHCTAVFSPCGRFVATGSEDHTAYIYDTRSSNFLHKLPRHSETVLNVAFNPANPEVKTH
ncbi:hypothetical protein cypCar_00024002 [Cyprinus carpio]|nr:hypothetical protein cypCar_00024002 [Cyprinus carpio]